MKTPQLSRKEEEVILLKAVQETIDSVINQEIILLSGENQETWVLPQTSVSQKYFNIILVDFLSRTDEKAPVKEKSFIGGLLEVARSPTFDVSGSISQMEAAVAGFKSWLDETIRVPTYFPTLGRRKINLEITRLRFSKMCGNLSKHSYLRAMAVAEEFQGLALARRRRITLEQAIECLPDFYERFHEDILNYHLGTISEFLNNIRWGIHDYLQPERGSSMTRSPGPGGTIKCTYAYPADVTNAFARSCYWELMNEVGRQPQIARFQVTKSLKNRY